MYTAAHLATVLKIRYFLQATELNIKMLCKYIYISKKYITSIIPCSKTLCHNFKVCMRAVSNTFSIQLLNIYYHILFKYNTIYLKKYILKTLFIRDILPWHLRNQALKGVKTKFVVTKSNFYSKFICSVQPLYVEVGVRHPELKFRTKDKMT